MSIRKDESHFYSEAVRLVAEARKSKINQKQFAKLCQQLAQLKNQSPAEFKLYFDQWFFQEQLQHLERSCATNSPARHINLMELGSTVLFRLGVLIRTLTDRKTTTRNCELVLSLLLNPSEQEPAIGDFFERYEQKHRRMGQRRANLWAYSDVIRTVWPVLKRRLGTILKLFIAADWVRRQFHQ